LKRLSNPVKTDFPKISLVKFRIFGIVDQISEMFSSYIMLSKTKSKHESSLSLYKYTEARAVDGGSLIFLRRQ